MTCEPRLIGVLSVETWQNLVERANAKTLASRGPTLRTHLVLGLFKFLR